MISQRELHRLLSYDPLTGVFKWKVKLGGGLVGAVAGRSGGGDDPLRPYWQIMIGGKRYYAHRLAWFYIYGYWPLPMDHIDMNKQNNALSNLREATVKQNAANTKIRRNNGLGFKGVRKHGPRYMARLCEDRKEKSLGYFDTPEEAHAAYCNALCERHGEYARGK